LNGCFKLKFNKVAKLRGELQHYFEQLDKHVLKKQSHKTREELMWCERKLNERTSTNVNDGVKELKLRNN
jgi:hypothetical protein